MVDLLSIISRFRTTTGLEATATRTISGKLDAIPFKFSFLPEIGPVRASAAFAGSPERHRQAKVGDERLELRDVGQGLGRIDVKCCVPVFEIKLIKKSNLGCLVGSYPV